MAVHKKKSTRFNRTIAHSANKHRWTCELMRAVQLAKKSNPNADPIVTARSVLDFLSRRGLVRKRPGGGYILPVIVD